jgi:hypothetical protein
MSIGEVVDIDTSIRLIMEAFAERKEALVKELEREIDSYLREADRYDDEDLYEFSAKSQIEASFRKSMIDRIRNI